MRVTDIAKYQSKHTTKQPLYIHADRMKFSAPEEVVIFKNILSFQFVYKDLDYKEAKK